ncbi:MAG: hypothetical protein K6T91_01535 [Firmicutes bacterium]|nr:hypothetical protein [Bacillota bacterium]
MELSIVQLSPKKISSFYVYLMLGLLFAQWIVVPYAASLYRLLIARRK